MPIEHQRGHVPSGHCRNRARLYLALRSAGIAIQRAAIAQLTH